MSWSNSFVEALSRRSLTPVFRVKLVSLPSLTRGASFGSIASHQSAGIAGMAASGVKISGSRVQSAGWRQTAGGFDIDLALDIETLRGFLNGWARGTPVQVEMSPDGIVDFEPFALGVIRDLEGVPPNIRLRCWDITAGLRSRITTDSTKTRLFESVDGSTTLNAGYTAGNTTVTVVSTTGFEAETSGSGVIKITPTTGDPFYLTYTGKTGTTFTGVSTTGQFGTTAVSAVTGDAVSEVGYVTGHPLDVVRKILVSSGSAVHGTFDVLPETWGFGLPDSIVDIGDMTRTKGSIVKVASGSYSWDILVEDPIDDGFSWLSSLLADAGMWMTVRQGLLTVRAAQDPNINSPTPYRTGIHIDDSNLSGISYHHRWDPARPVEYKSVRISSSSSDLVVTEDFFSLPASDEIVYDVADRVFSNELEVRTEIRRRLASWALRIPERIGIRVGLEFSRLATGDLVTFSTKYTQGRIKQNETGFSQRHVMVTAVTPEVMRGSTLIEIAALPSREDV